MTPPSESDLAKRLKMAELTVSASARARELNGEADKVLYGELVQILGKHTEEAIKVAISESAGYDDVLGKVIVDADAVVAVIAEYIGPSVAQAIVRSSHRRNRWMDGIIARIVATTL